MTRNDVTRVTPLVLCWAFLVACGSSTGESAGTGGGAGQDHGGAGGGPSAVSGGTGNVPGGAGTAGSMAGGAGMCSGFEPCGGSLVGRWKVVKVCATAAEAKQFGDDIKLCPESSIVVSLTSTGIVEFDAQGVVKYDTVTSAHLAESVPASCVASEQDCAGVQAAIIAQPETTAATCRATAAGCDCVYDISAPHRVESSYVAAGTKYTETNVGDGKKTTADYCVNGTSLRISDDTAVVELVSSP